MTEKRLKVLVVDDDAFVRELLSMLLDMGGYDIETAEDGADAIKKFESDRNIDLVISDMNMPGINGLELITEIRKLDTEVPIIILTGHDDVTIVTEAVERGAEDYIVKDENIQETFLTSVEKILEKYRLRKGEH